MQSTTTPSKRKFENFIVKKGNICIPLEKKMLTYIPKGYLFIAAAHCVRPDHRNLRPQDLIVILGKLNIQRWTQSDGGRMIDLESIHVHPDYQPLSSDADIAVLILNEKLEFTKLIRPICLWNTESNVLELIVGEQLFFICLFLKGLSLFLMFGRSSSIIYCALMFHCRNSSLKVVVVKNNN